jgi:hypothetical protein
LFSSCASAQETQVYLSFLFQNKSKQAQVSLYFSSETLIIIWHLTHWYFTSSLNTLV